MARGVEPYSKIEPSFVLGRSETGMRFTSMSEKAQLCYLRLWNRALETRSDVIFCQKSSEKFKVFSKNLGYSPTLFYKFLCEILEKKLAKRIDDETCILIGVKDKHPGMRWKSSPNGERMGTECAPNAPHPVPKQVVEVRGKRNTPPTPRKPDPEEGGGIYEELIRKYPALTERGITRESLRKACANRNGETSAYLAVVVACCEDKDCKLPLAAAPARLAAGGVDPKTRKTIERILAGEPAVPPRPVPMSDEERAEVEARREREAKENAKRVTEALKVNAQKKETT